MAKPNEFADAEKNISQQMKDPLSTEFQNLRIIKSNEGKVFVCGEVNAKNSYGGYEGFRQFAYSEGRSAIAGSFDTPDDLDFYSTSGCGGEQLKKVAMAQKQAVAGCDITWHQITDVVLFNMSYEKAADNAILRVRELNPKFNPADTPKLKAAFIDSMSKTLNNDSFRNSVKTNTNVTEVAFKNQCRKQVAESLSGN